ncbi:MAG: hypothetical protein KAQ75_03350, partial [Bacteroidales bacterium]|nr:hypothetical protein [Bacteroidales bacterium]
MKKTKRIIVATLAGILFGFACLGLASSGGSEIPCPVKLQILFSRTLIGFAIGISGLKFHWTYHGLLMGLIFSLPIAFSGLIAPEDDLVWMFGATVIMGMIYGFLIELITS